MLLNHQFNFRPLKESDLPLLTKWLGQPHLKGWWDLGDITHEKVQKEYLPREFGKDTARPYIAWLNQKPVGYIQYYFAAEGDPNWWPDDPGSGVLGIDQFLVIEDKLNQGIGTIMVSEFVNYLFKNPDVREIRVDPHPDNLRAIHCYKKVGFQEVGKISTPDGPALMMIIDKESFLSKKIDIFYF